MEVSMVGLAELATWAGKTVIGSIFKGWYAKYIKAPEPIEVDLAYAERQPAYDPKRFGWVVSGKVQKRLEEGYKFYLDPKTKARVWAGEANSKVWLMLR